MTPIDSNGAFLFWVVVDFQATFTKGLKEKKKHSSLCFFFSSFQGAAANLGIWMKDTLSFNLLEGLWPLHPHSGKPGDWLLRTRPFALFKTCLQNRSHSKELIHSWGWEVGSCNAYLSGGSMLFCNNNNNPPLQLEFKKSAPIPALWNAYVPKTVANVRTKDSGNKVSQVVTQTSPPATDSWTLGVSFKTTMVARTISIAKNHIIERGFKVWFNPRLHQQKYDKGKQ